MNTTTSTLYLLRHAKAEPALSAMTKSADHSRPLASRGREDSAAMGGWMRAQSVAVDLALVSSAMRTAETYDLLQPLSPAPRRVDLDDLYLAEADQLLAILQKQHDVRGILVVAHNPGLHELALHLSGGNSVQRKGLPTCTLVEFNIEAAWCDLGPSRTSLSMIHRP